MSFLPQRKKSAEEIAQLRDALGVPAARSSAEMEVEKNASVEPSPLPPADAFDLKPGDSFVDDFSFVPMIDIGADKLQPAAREPEPVVTKLTLREDRLEVTESFTLPVTPAAPAVPETLPVLSALAAVEHDDGAGDAKIPSQKHTPAEIERLRREMAFAQVESVYNPRLKKAHPFLIAMGYISVLAGVIIAFFYHQPMIVTAPFVGVSLLVALIILLRSPISRHHAGFIFAICFLAIAFGILHYFPHLQHAA